ncbi:MAG: P-II family nitrogen regulator [Deltaproteobacteria bacterium]|nr:P-II family nitrogen regulator [Deltaproteobacteria bacterium]
MKMIRAVIRPENVESVVEGLAEGGFVSLTKIQAFGRGRQKGITVGGTHYDELPKTTLIMVVAAEAAEKALELICGRARTGRAGDGKIFVSPVEAAVTISSGQRGL